MSPDTPFVLSMSSDWDNTGEEILSKDVLPLSADDPLFRTFETADEETGALIRFGVTCTGNGGGGDVRWGGIALTPDATDPEDEELLGL